MNILELSLGAFTLAAVLTPAHLHAQSEPDLEEIVVTGGRVDVPTVRDQAQAYVRAITADPIEGQLARWTGPVCPKAIGLGEAHAEIVVQTIRRTAMEAGAPVAKVNCQPNIVVAFTTDAPDLMRRLGQHRPSPFTEVPRAERAKLMEGHHPIRWWTTTLTVGSSGHPVTTASAALLNQPDIPLGPSGRVLSSYGSTLIGTNVEVGLRSVTVVVDVDAASGSTLNALAARVAMVALAPIRLGGGSGGAPSVLAVDTLQPDRWVQNLTEWDRAYLAALYSGPGNRTAASQRARIAGHLASTIGR